MEVCAKLSTTIYWKSRLDRRDHFVDSFSARCFWSCEELLAMTERTPITMGEIAKRRNRRMVVWHDCRMAEWQNGRVAEWQNGRMAE